MESQYLERLEALADHSEQQAQRVMAKLHQAEQLHAANQRVPSLLTAVVYNCYAAHPGKP